VQRAPGVPHALCFLGERFLQKLGRIVPRDRAFVGEGREHVAVRSAHLTIFWHCDFRYFSFKTDAEARLGNEPSMVLAED
jgi:hypothetical protein